MCLAVPGRVLSVDGEDTAFRQGVVDFGGIRKTVNLAYTPEVRVGQYVIVHVGFALSVVDEAEAQRVLDTYREMDALAELSEDP